MEQLIKLSRDLEYDYILKLAFISVGIENVPQEILERAKDLMDILNCIQRVLSSEEESITFIYHSLKHLDCQSKHLQSVSRSDSLIKDYDMRLRHPSASYRILLLKILKDLSSKKYNDIKTVVKSVLGVRMDGLEMHHVLANYMVCEIMVDHTDSEPIRALSNSCPSRRWIEEFYKDLPCSPQVDSNLEKRTQFIKELKEHRSRRKSERRAKVLKCICLGIIILLYLSVVTGGIATTSAVATKHGDSRGKVNISDYNIIAVDDEGFGSNLESVHLSLVTKGDSSVAINVYQDDCAATNTSTITLNETTLPPLCPPYFKRLPYNYNKLDAPLYALKGSLIQFHITAILNPETTTTTGLDTKCFRIRIFTRRDLYLDAINPGERYIPHVPGSIAESPCISIGTQESPLTSNWTYVYNASQYVYATIDVGANIEITGSITGRISRYQLYLPSSLPCSPLTLDYPDCEIKICGGVCGKSTVHPFQCIYIQLQQFHYHSNQVMVTPDSEYELEYTSRLPIYKLWFFVSGTITIFVAILGLVPLLIFLLYRYCYHRHRCCPVLRIPKNNTCIRQHSQDSNQYLLN